MIEFQMQHLNYNMLCAMSIRTSGPNPLKHDIVKISVVALDHHMRMSQKVMPFIMDIKPRRPENIDYKSAEVKKPTLIDIGIKGTDAYDAADRFEEWFNHLELPGRKRIVPLVYNWSKMKPFILDWLGFETCNQLIADQVRDLLVLAVAANDKSCVKGRKCPYGKPIFPYLCTVTKVQRFSKDPEGDCYAMIDLYKGMLLREPLTIGGQF